MASQLTESVGEGSVARRSRATFFFMMSVVFLAIVLIGFAPTLYLRGMFFPVGPIPAVVYAHGFVMTAWYVWFFIQTSLIRTGDFQRHRQLGTVGAFIGLGVVITGLTVTLGVVSRLKGINGLDFASDVSVLGLGKGTTVAAFLSSVVWSNFAIALSFSGLLASAILFRRQPQVHKRLMLLASLCALGPALARISRWPGLGGDVGPFVPIALALLLVILVAHDFSVRKRVHAATLVGGGAAVLVLLAGQLIGASKFGQTFAMGL